MTSSTKIDRNTLIPNKELTDIRRGNDFKKEHPFQMKNGLYGDQRSPIQIIQSINLTKITMAICQKRSRFLPSLPSVSTRQGLPEEIKDASGRYANNEILIHPRYVDITGNEILSADFYDQFFSRDHRTNTPKKLEPYTKSAALRMNHMVEDIVTHEYGHHIFEHVFKKQLYMLKSDFEQIPYSEPIELAVKPINEAFALRSHDTISGHHHAAVNEFKAFPEDDNYYKFKDITFDLYTKLSEISTEKGIPFVLDNFVLIATPFLQDLQKRASAQRKQKAMNDSSFEIIQVISPQQLVNQ